MPGTKSGKAKLTFPESSYYPDILQTNYSEKELRDEYTRLRDIGQKRLKRLAEKYPESATAQKWKEGIPKLRDLQSVSDIAHGLSELSSLIQSEASTLTGQKKIRENTQETIDKIHKHYKDDGIPDLRKGNNFDKFTRVMNAQVSNNIEKIFGSDRAVMLFKVLEEKGIKNINPFISTPSRMAYWLDNLENLEAVNLPKGKYKSAKAYKDLVESEIFHGRDRREVRISTADDIISGKRDTRKERNNRHTRSSRQRKRNT